MKKSNLAFVAVAAASAFALAACSGGGSPASDADASEISGEISMLTPLFASDADKAAFEESLQGFYKKYPDAKLTVDYTDYGKLNEKVTSGLASGLLPDIVQIGVGWIPPLASKGVLAPLDELGFSADDLEKQFPEAAAAAAQYDGGVYAVPFVTQGVQGVYNKTMFEAAGLDPETPPRTWDELEAAAEATTIRDGSGSLVQAGFTAITDNLRQNFIALLGTQGAPLFDEDGAAQFNSPEGVAAADFLDRLVNDDKVTDVGFEDGAPQPPILSGKAAIALYGAYIACDNPDIVDPALCEDLGYFTIPGPEASDPGAVFLGGTMSAITKGSKHPEAAAALIRYMSEEPEVAFSTSASTYGIPTAKASWSDERVSGNAAAAAYLESIDLAVTEGGPTTWLDTRNDFIPTLQSVILSGEDAQTALDALAAKSDAAN